MPPKNEAWTLDEYRAYLYFLARLKPSGHFRAKFDASDLVQETLVQAQRHLGQLKALTAPERFAWLKQVMAHVMADQIRRYTGEKRNLDLERSLQQTLDESSARLDHWLASDSPSPSEKASRQEQMQQIQHALEQLSEREREALLLQKIEGLSLKEIGARLEATPQAVGGLLRRAVAKLRKLMEPGR